MVMGRKIYPLRPDLHGKFFYECEPCKAYVGCHPSSQEPLGRLANAQLRAMKQAAHAAFDPLWKYYGMSRTGAYAWLACRLHLLKEDCHIGFFDEETCMKVVRECDAEVARRKEENKANNFKVRGDHAKLG